MVSPGTTGADVWSQPVAPPQMSFFSVKGFLQSPSKPVLASSGPLVTLKVVGISAGLGTLAIDFGNAFEFRVPLGFAEHFAEDGGVRALRHAVHAPGAVLGLVLGDFGRDVGEVALADVLREFQRTKGIIVMLFLPAG